MRIDTTSGFASLLALLLSVAFFVPHAGAQTRQLPDKLELHGGQVVVFRSDRPIDRVAVGNSALVEVTTIERRQLVIIAGASTSGFTTLHVWHDDGSQRSVGVDVDVTRASSVSGDVRRMLGTTSKAVVTDIGGKVVISGELGAAEAQRVQAVAKLYPTVLDLTSQDPVGMQPMVLMDVRIMEFRKDSLRNLGIRWDNVIHGPSAGLIKDFSSSPFRILPDGSPFAGAPLPARINPGQSYFGIATSIGSTIDLLTRNGDAYELASPQLSARSGGSAEFLAGGEVPIPTSAGFGATNVEFKDYGIKLNVQPVVNSNEEISTTVSTEVSRIDPAVTVQGIPGFITRRTQTEINVRAGQTIVISGLVDLHGSKGIAGLPGLAHIPILGHLFRSDAFRAGRTDLVVFVTPRIFTPGSPANVEALQKGQRIEGDFKRAIDARALDAPGATEGG